ncbi:MAG: pyridoxal-phosphate dependent enzyme, partial [Pseudomonadota bacterium]
MAASRDFQRFPLKNGVAMPLTHPLAVPQAVAPGQSFDVEPFETAHDAWSDADDYLRRILTARVYDVARETALEAAPTLSAHLGHRVWFKREDHQPVFSFKVRGAYNKMASLPADALARGVITAS